MEVKQSFEEDLPNSSSDMKQNHHNLYSLLLSVVSILFLSAGKTSAQQRVLPDSLTDKYLEAFDLNEQKDYLSAFAQLKQLNKEMDTYLEQRQIQPSQLTTQEFVFPYWAIKKSMAEVAYKLGLYEVMNVTKNALTKSYMYHRFEEGRYDAHNKDCLADILRIYANSQQLICQDTEAEKFLNIALQQKQEDFDFESATRNDLAQLYYKQRRYEEALCQLDTILAGKRYGEDARVRGSESTLHEIQSQRALCMAQLGNYDEALKLMKPIVDYYRKMKDARGLAEALRKTAKILMLRFDATENFDKAAITYYHEYPNVSRQYVDEHFVQMSESEREQYWLAEQPFTTDCYRLENKDASLLYDVALYSKAILLQMGKTFKTGMTVNQRRLALAAIRKNWQDVQRAMQPNSVSIEFVTYEKKGKQWLGAIVLGKTAKKPVFIPIGIVQVLKKHLLTPNLTVEQALTSNENEYKNKLYHDEWLELAIWNEQLVSAIGNAKNVYFAADGILHLLAIEYMLPKQLTGKKLYRMTSTRSLTEKAKKLCTDKMLLCGGVDYDFSWNPYNKKGNDQTAYYKMSSNSLSLPYLRGSQSEVDSIITLRKEHRDTLLTGSIATEVRIRNLMEQYPVIHLATHGYFSDSENTGSQLYAASTDRQLSNSCLFLSGSEQNMRNAYFDPSNMDGILSARELASQDLSQVGLVVLSACQSGQGYLTMDGIYGLQRGLKTAGVKAIIASLWNVDDEASVYLMKNLYANLEKGLPLRDAFEQARQTLKTTTSTIRLKRAGNLLPELYIQRSFSEPQYSNAFILIDGNE